MPKLDAWCERHEQIKRKIRCERLNATCPHCEADVLSALLPRAHDWAGYGPPSSVLFECPNCEEEIEFDLRWEKTVLCWAMPTVEP